MEIKVSRVDRVYLTVYRSIPPMLVVVASATVPTSGWKNARLVPRLIESKPAEGVWEFDLIADAPEGPVLQIISAIQSAQFVAELPDWLVAVRIHGSHNSMELSLKDALADPVKLIAFPGKSSRGIDAWPLSVEPAKEALERFSWTIKV